MVYLRPATKCIVVFLLLCTFTNIIECGRGGGGRSSSGGSRGSSGGRGWSWSGSSWGSRSSSSSGSSSNHGSSSGYGSSSAINLSPSRTSHTIHSSSGSTQGVSSGRVTKPNSNTHSSSHVLPLSTGSRTEKVQQSHVSSQHATPSLSPSAPPISGQHNTGGNYAPSAPPLPTSNNKPAPAPGWNVGNDGNIRRDQTQGLNNAHFSNQPGAPMHPPPYSSVSNQPGAGMYPPPYSSVSNQPGAGMHPPPYSSVSNQPGTGMHPPPYSAGSNHYSNAPPPYPGGINNYPGPPLSGVPPPSYPGTHFQAGGHYPSGTQYYPGGTQNNYRGMGGYYPTQHGGQMNHPNYQNQQYYPQSNSLPPPPPGYSPYGVPYYQKPKSGIKASHVMMGLALWQMTRPHHHHHFYGSGYDTYNNPGYGYHEFNRQRYTTTYGAQHPSSNAPGAHNTLEMTHYVIPDEKGAYKTVVGNMTCLSLYDAKAVSIWANRTMDDFYRKFPGSEFPLFDTGKNATNKFENFTMQPGRIIHEETVSVTCCGTDKGPLELSMLTSGKSPDVNCIHFVGKIPFRKLTFIKVHHVPAVNVSMEDWKPIQLVEPNLNSTSTPTPLAPFPTTVNTTDSTSSTTPSVDLTQTFAPLGINNNITSSTTLEEINIENSTFPSLGSINSTTPSNENTFPSLGSENNTISSPPS